MLLGERSQTEKDRLYDAISIKYPEQANAETENRPVTARGWGGEWGVTATDDGVSS